MAKHKKRSPGPVMLWPYRNQTAAPALPFGPMTPAPVARAASRARGAAAGGKLSWATMLAGIGGGAAGALLGGLLVRAGANRTWAAGILTATGIVGAIFTRGNLRAAAAGIASTGAGQVALALLAKPAGAARPAQVQGAPPPPVQMPPRHRQGMDDVADMFARVRRQMEQA